MRKCKTIYIILIPSWVGHRRSAKQLTRGNAARARFPGRSRLVAPLISRPLGALVSPEGQVDGARTIAASGTSLRSHPESRVTQ